MRERGRYQLARPARVLRCRPHGHHPNNTRCIAGPSSPRESVHDGETAWRLVSHLNLNYLSQHDATGGSAAIREVLALYTSLGDPLLRVLLYESRPVLGIVVEVPSNAYWAMPD